MAGVCPYQILSGHTAIVSHDHCSRGSVANYGGRCPVGQRLMDHDGPATWLVTLELNPAAISRLCYSRRAQRRREASLASRGGGGGGGRVHRLP